MARFCSAAFLALAYLVALYVANLTSGHGVVCDAPCGSYDIHWPSVVVLAVPEGMALTLIALPVLRIARQRFWMLFRGAAVTAGLVVVFAAGHPQIFDSFYGR